MLATREREGYWRVRRIYVIKNNVKTGEWQQSKWPICNKSSFASLRSIVREAGRLQVYGDICPLFVSFHMKKIHH